MKSPYQGELGRSPWGRNFRGGIPLPTLLNQRHSGSYPESPSYRVAATDIIS